MPGCLYTGGAALVLYVLSFFVLHEVAHCQPSEEVGELPSLVELSVACAPEVQFRRATLEHEGRRGIWFAEAVAQCMAGRLRLVPELRKIVDLQEQRIRLGDDKAANLTRRLEVSAEIETALRDAVTLAEKGRREAEARAGRWTRHPGLWFAVGIVTTVALQVAATRVINAAGAP
jgi:hypothetical protein